MLAWLKVKVKQGIEAGQKVIIANSLTSHFAPLEDPKTGIPGIGSRLARFVLDGEDHNAVAELVKHRTSSRTYYVGDRHLFAKGLGTLLKILPEDPEIYCRLASVYEAASTTAYSAQYSPIPGFKGGYRWVYAFLAELSDAGPKNEKYFSADLLAAMLASKQEPPAVLVRGALVVLDQQGKNQFNRWTTPPYKYFRCLRQFSDLVLQFPEVVTEALHQSNAAARAYTLMALTVLEIPVDSFLDEIAALAVSNSKEVRESATPIIEKAFAAFQPLLAKFASSGTSDERYNAVRLLGRFNRDDSRRFLQERLESEKAEKVLEALRECLSTPQVTGNSLEVAGTEEWGLARIPEVPVFAPLDNQVLRELRSCIDEFERRAAEEFGKNEWARKHNKTRTPVASDTADRLFQALQDFVVTVDKTWDFVERTYSGSSFGILQKFAAHPQFQLIHLVRWCLLLSGRTNKRNDVQWAHWLLSQWRESFLAYQKARKRPIDLREVAAVFKTVGLDDHMIGEQLLRETKYAPSPIVRSDGDLIWPYFAERLSLLEETLGLKQVVSGPPSYYFNEKDRRQKAFEVLQLFPRLPRQFVPVMWEIALGPSKTERSLAQQCLAKFPDKEGKILAALAGRQQDARFAAAEWIASLNHKEAIPALRSALAKEKSEVVKDQLIRTLEFLGVGLEELLDLETLDREAEKGLKKGIPDDLAWFPFDQLPVVHWRDSAKQVPQAMLQWFLLQGHRLKNAEANPTLRRYCSLFRKDEAERLGRFVLDAWIAKDTKPKYNSEQAAALAEKEAAQAAAMAKQYPKYYPDFDQQKLYQAAFNRLLIEPEGSQTTTKGILAVAGACCGGDAAPVVHRYIKQWYGYRSAQAKALLQVLAWTEHPSATQVVLAVANRFRTKGIQEEALRLCQLLAERKGWTLDELGDRTIPTASLDENGALELDYGSRQFFAQLSDDLTLTLTNQNGKTISSLPDANQSDDPEKVKQAKSALSAARKELKSVVSMQKERLYEALCTQRKGDFEDWDLYLRKHPIVGRYCQRLVWAIYDGGKILGTFRPMADGSLTDHQDEEVTVNTAATIRLAHEETLSVDDRQNWLQHFSDYKVEPLFQQFGKQTYSLPAAMKESTEIADFLGHVVKAFSLRNRLTRLGYTRGAAQDGGWFFDYHKTFPSLGIEAIIEFTGNGLPEENRTVALQRLSFARRNVPGNQGIPEQIALGELPRVLLTECWNDIRMAAAEGSGFAEDWQKQTEY